MHCLTSFSRWCCCNLSECKVHGVRIIFHISFFLFCVFLLHHNWVRSKINKQFSRRRYILNLIFGFETLALNDKALTIYYVVKCSIATGYKWSHWKTDCDAFIHANIYLWQEKLITHTQSICFSILLPLYINLTFDLNTQTHVCL